jgi:2-oxoisovalerate dehydrogenase E2 component (dihydrolipoyl transacylase)
MGIHVIKMPDIGEGIAEVELVGWHVKPGDAIVEDQPLADVMTDKATVEIPSPVHGKVLALGGQVGDVMAVGAELIRIEVEGEGNVAAGAAQVVARSAAPVPAAAPAPEPAAAPPPQAEAAPSPQRRPMPAPAPQPRAPGERPIASPAVRRRAWELGIELQFVPGSGSGGRILHEDLDAWLTRRETPPAGGLRLVERHDEQQVQIIGLRRKIAQKMQEAKRRIPHFTYVEEIDVTELEALRAQLNERHGTARGHLTLLPLLARAVVLALRDFPQINARFDDDAGIVTRYGAVHLGVATQTDGGLMVPVVRHAEARDPWASGAEIARLAEAARSGKAAREELTGSTLTITSLGALGGIVTTPVINYPEVAIVGVGRIVERPVIRGGQVVARKLINLSSSFDHRVVDGADAARFIQAVRGLLECPALLFVD